MELTLKTVVTNPVYLLAFGFGSGLAPVAPGTFGTFAGLPLYLGLALLPAWLYAVVTIAFTILGCWLCDVAEKDCGVPDHAGIVWDEIIGLLWTLWLVPTTVFGVMSGLVLFRLFDITKPWPIRVVDHQVKGGVGIMLDDLFAAVYAWVCLQALLWLV